MTETASPNRTQLLAPMTNAQIKQRIKANQDAKFGMENATAAQLNVVYIIAKRTGLDPVTDLTLFQGQPFIKLEGHLRLMRAHPDYRGFEQHPLDAETKTAWGYDEADIVIETTIKTANWGDITQRGVVFADEIEQARATAKTSGRRAAPLGIHYVAIAEKRSIARAQRAAFGQDMPTEEEIAHEVEVEMERRADPAETRRLSAQYDQFFGDPPELPMGRPEPDAASPAVDVIEPESPGAAPQIDEWARHRDLAAQARQLKLTVKTLRNDIPIDEVREYNDLLGAEIEQSFMSQAHR